MIRAKFLIPMPYQYGFGDAGAPLLGIGPSSRIDCEIELVRIHPALQRTLKSIGYNESIKEDLMNQIYTGRILYIYISVSCYSDHISCSQGSQ